MSLFFGENIRSDPQIQPCFRPKDICHTALIACRYTQAQAVRYEFANRQQPSQSVVHQAHLHTARPIYRRPVGLPFYIRLAGARVHRKQYKKVSYCKQIARKRSAASQFFWPGRRPAYSRGRDGPGENFPFA